MAPRLFSGDMEMASSSQRLDKWLWFSRLVKTRTQATRLIHAGKVRVNRSRVSKPAFTIACGDIITAMIHRRLRVVKVLQTGNRRGPASEAAGLYEDLTPQVRDSSKPEKGEAVFKPKPPARKQGAGRPTKRDRRKMKEFENRAAEKSSET